MKKNLLTTTILALFLVISITFVAMPASADEQDVFYCNGTEEVSIIDDPGLELTMKCEGGSVWAIEIEEFGIGDLGEAFLVYYVYNDDTYVEEINGVYSPQLLVSFRQVCMNF